MLTTWPLRLRLVPFFSGCHPFFMMSLYLLPDMTWYVAENKGWWSFSRNRPGHTVVRLVRLGIRNPKSRCGKRKRRIKGTVTVTDS